MTPCSPQLDSERRPTSRPAFTFIEVAISAAMVAVLLLLVSQLLVMLKRHSQAAERHLLAMQTVENSLEEFTARPWNEIETARIAELKLPESIVKRWPNAKLSGEVAGSTESTPAKRIVLKLTLTPDLQTPTARLATWVFRTPSAATE